MHSTYAKLPSPVPSTAPRKQTDLTGYARTNQRTNPFSKHAIKQCKHSGAQDTRDKTQDIPANQINRSRYTRRLVIIILGGRQTVEEEARQEEKKDDGTQRE